MTDDLHLTEDERQLLADDALPPDRARAVAAHLATCTECADDIARLRSIMARYRQPFTPDESAEELWPSIRARIENEKIVPLEAAQPSPRRRRPSVRHIAALGALAAGIMLTVVLLRPSHRIPVEPTTAASDTTALRLVADSVRSYEDETRVLLNRLEVQRALMRPDAAQSIDRDLKVIDDAIAELQQAIANDPRNAALRHLLAASYRQKIDLLKRAGNAS
jgi:anti-sigma factor RsiW